jgi:hypothetical protein
LTRKQLDIRFILKKLNAVDKLSYLFFGEDCKKLDGAINPYIYDKGSRKSNINNKINDIQTFQNFVFNNYNELFLVEH